MNTVAIVTGGARGIGWATARRLAEESAHVVIVDMDGETAQARAQELGHDHLGLKANITSPSDVTATINTVIGTFGRIDVLVNNAGIVDQAGATIKQDIDNFQRVLNVHLSGTFLASKSAAEHMLRQGAGAIINLSSIAGFGGIPGRNAYSAAKAGIAGMTRSMACEWARSGVRVNAVAPGYVRTDLVEELLQRGDIDGASLEARTPMGRLAAPEEIANAIYFLASPQSSYITGAVLAVDGGWMALGAPESAL